MEQTSSTNQEQYITTLLARNIRILLEHPDFSRVSDGDRYFARQMLNKGALACAHDIDTLHRDNSFDHQFAREYLTHKLEHIRDAARSYIERQAGAVVRNHCMELEKRV